MMELRMWARAARANPEPEAPSDSEATDEVAETQTTAWTRPLRAVAPLLDPIFLLILALGILLRFYGLNWDQGFHLHPDERFLTMVGNAASIPHSLAQYLDPSLSTLNPANLNYQFFVYGAFPVTLNKVLAVLTHHDTYDAFTQQGRFLSALADTIIVILVYLAAGLLQERYELPRATKYLATFFYAIAVLPIQLAHFFAVDSFLACFMFASIWLALRYSLRGGTLNVAASGLCFGLALASKTSGIFAAPLIAFLLALGIVGDQHAALLFGRRREILELLRKNRRAWATETVWVAILFGLVAYVTLRLADPYIFQNSSLLDPRLSTLFIHNLQQLRSFDTPAAWYPPGVQWIHKTPIVFSLTNIAFFGVGVAAFIFVLIGLFVIATRQRHLHLIAFAVWAGLFFVFQSTQYVKTMRYFIFIYPFLAIFAAIGFAAITRRGSVVFRAALLIGVSIWTIAFMSIYTRDHSRVQASQWIYDHLPNNAYILSESWDDPLPLQILNTHGKAFRGDQLPVFDPDTADKWKKMTSLLAKGDYLVLSSNRGWASMPTVPERYPLMTQFYSNLFAGKLRYRKIAQFTSYPSLRYLGIPIDFPDQWSEEAFTVYDHPEVMIFQRVR